VTVIEYRHPTTADVEKIVDVINRAGRELPLHDYVSKEEIETTLFKDNHFDAKDSCCLAVIHDQFVGCGIVFAEKSRIKAGKNDADITIEVVPEHRDEGIQRALMHSALEFLRSVKIHDAKHLCAGTTGWKHDLSHEFGFRDDHHGYTLICRVGKEPRASLPPDGIHLEHMMFKEASDEDILDLTNVYNNFYSDILNFAPELVESWIEYRDELRENVERITFAKEGARIVGACSCEEWTGLNRQGGVRAGFVSTVGVIKPYRRKGIGRALLSDAVKWLHERGMDTVYLRVDARNPDALRLYTSSGFEIFRESVVYHLALE